MATDFHLLQIHTAFSTLTDAEHAPVTLQISPHAIATRHWPQGRPGPLQLERAIDDVENAIEQAGLTHGDRGVLRGSEDLGALLHPALYPAGITSREAVEAAFSRLVAAASGGAGHQAEASGESAAALLMVRELMHHLGFQALRTGG